MNKFSFVVSFAFGCVLAGCSGSTGKVNPGTPASDGGQTAGDDTSSNGSDAGTSSSSNDGGATTGGDGGSTTTTDDRIDPISVGHSWTYTIEEFGNYPVCPGGIHTGTATHEATVDGKTAIEVVSACANAGSAYFTIQGDVVQVDDNGTWLLALDSPVQEGHTWSNGSSTFTWHDAGDVTVPAGTFHECFSATQNVSYTAYTIFCRGVGPVRWYTKDLNGDGYDAQLTQKNF